MKYRKIAAMTLFFSLVFASCGSTASENSSFLTSVSKEAISGGIERYEGKTAEEIVASLTTEQKAAQMVEGAFYNVSP
jgi:beta-glucosidase